MDCKIIDLLWLLLYWIILNIIYLLIYSIWSSFVVFLLSILSKIQKVLDTITFRSQRTTKLYAQTKIKQYNYGYERKIKVCEYVYCSRNLKWETSLICISMNIKRNLKSIEILSVSHKLERLKYIQHLRSHNFKTRCKKYKAWDERPTRL